MALDAFMASRTRLHDSSTVALIHVLHSSSAGAASTAGAASAGAAALALDAFVLGSSGAGYEAS